jgi:acetyl/propionyl-CoA carboxylase alpha subunit
VIRAEGCLCAKTAERPGIDGPVTSRPFRCVLVANRGEIALRIMRACRELDIRAVAVYSDADAGTRHVRAADAALRIGPAPATESYLRADRIVEAAVAAGADAVHPGYGFLSEQAPFAVACAAAGLAFVGPGPETLASLGDKLAARRTARARGVPIVPGTFQPLPAVGPDSTDAITREARSVGFPLLVKAAAGGGGRGMRRVDDPGALPAAVAAAAREAGAAFGDSSVYLERYVEGARHVEVQLVGDAHGAVVALGERDCSTQRRHQKLVEEAPAPGLSPEQRRHLHGLAVEVARSVGLQNAATAEFLLSADGEFFFLEMNARLQVEHGVTELVAGVDLVHEQLWLAAGRPISPRVLAAAVAAPDPGRHAIEVRISAEDPARAFAPAPGRLTRWREPGGPWVRVDSAAEEGMLVGSDYDPLLAKVMVAAEDRTTALSRLRRAILEFETGGVQTTLPFHQWLLWHPAFLEARLRTDLVDRDWDPVPVRAAAARRALQAVAQLVATSPPGAAAHGNPGPAGPPTSLDSGWTLAARREASERWP